MIPRIALLLAAAYVPLMWALVALHGLLALIGLLAPRSFRNLARTFTQPTLVRLLGVGLMLVGAELFVRGGATSFSGLVKTLGVLMFVSGGVRLFIPNVSVILTEWWIERSDAVFRALGLACLGLAYLFYLVLRHVNYET